MVRRNAIANFAGSGWAALMTIVFIPVYIRTLGIEAYAIIALQPVLHAWLSFLDAGIAPALSREIARFRAGARDAGSTLSLLRTVEVMWAILALVVVVALVSADHAIGGMWLNRDALPAASIARGIDLLVLLTMLRLLETAYHGALIGLEQLVWYNGWSATFATFRHGGAALVVLFVSPTIEAFFIWQLAVAIIGLAIFAIRVHRAVGRGSIGARPSLRRLAEIGRFTAGTSLITIMAIVLSQVDKLLLSGLASLEGFGYYMLASSVASALYIAVVPVAQAVYPRFVDLVSRDRDHELSALYHRATALVTVICGTAAAVLFLLPVATLFAWSGDMRLAERVAPILAPAALGTFLHALTNIPYQLQLAFGWTGLSLRAYVAATIVYVPALFVVVPQWGGVGAAWLWVALNAALVIVIMPLMHRRVLIGEFSGWLGFDVLLPFVAAAAVVAVGGAVAGIAGIAGTGRGFWIEWADVPIAALQADGSRPLRALEIAVIALLALVIGTIASRALRPRGMSALDAG